MATLLLTLALANAASTSQFSREYDACMDASGGVTSEMRDCSAAEGKRLDEMLNREYRLALERLPNIAARSKLRQSERNWLKVRYKHCAKEAEPERGGTMWLLIMDSCGLSEDASRIEWLKRYGR